MGKFIAVVCISGFLFGTRFWWKTASANRGLAIQGNAVAKQNFLRGSAAALFFLNMAIMLSVALFGLTTLMMKRIVAVSVLGSVVVFVIRYRRMATDEVTVSKKADKSLRLETR